MTDALIQWFTTTLGGLLSEEVIVFIISMVPILELRGGLVAAKLLGIELLPANLLCIIGNIIMWNDWEYSNCLGIIQVNV